MGSAEGEAKNGTLPAKLRAAEETVLGDEDGLKFWISMTATYCGERLPVEKGVVV